MMVIHLEALRGMAFTPRLLYGEYTTQQGTARKRSRAAGLVVSPRSHKRSDPLRIANDQGTLSCDPKPNDASKMNDTSRSYQLELPWRLAI